MNTPKTLTEFCGMPPDSLGKYLNGTMPEVICKVVHGSRLYRLHSDSSDYDEKGIFLPDMRDCLLGVAEKNICWKEPEQNKEHEMFSLTEFFKHAARGEGYALDMLHCQDSDILKGSQLWSYLRANRSKFYTKKMVGALGYAKNHAAKYSLKAERLNAAKIVLEFLNIAESKGVGRLCQVWGDLPTGQHITKGEDENNRNADKRFVEVSGKKLPATISPSYAAQILENAINSYGERTKLASEMNEKDVKAISHSFRVGYQLLHIYKDGDFSYPLPETEFLKKVKYRQIDHKVERIDDMLNELVCEVEDLAAKSNYRDKVDSKWLDEIVLAQYGQSFCFDA